MAEAGFSFNRPYKPFGLNVKVPERTLKLAGETLENLAKGPTDPLFKFLEENEEVFNGDLFFQINRVTAQSFTIGSAMRMEDEKMNGMPLQEVDRVIYPVCTLCRDHERAGFVEGVRMGILLAQEVGR